MKNKLQLTVNRPSSRSTVSSRRQKKAMPTKSTCGRSPSPSKRDASARRDAKRALLRRARAAHAWLGLGLGLGLGLTPTHTLYPNRNPNPNPNSRASR